jgi:hypothetical protein
MKDDATLGLETTTKTTTQGEESFQGINWPEKVCDDIIFILYIPVLAGYLVFFRPWVRGRVSITYQLGI